MKRQLLMIGGLLVLAGCDKSAPPPPAALRASPQDVDFADAPLRGQSYNVAAASLHGDCRFLLFHATELIVGQYTEPRLERVDVEERMLATPVPKGAYVSNAPHIVELTDKGMLHAKAPGRAHLTFSYCERNHQVKVVVSDPTIGPPLAGRTPRHFL